MKENSIYEEDEYCLVRNIVFRNVLKDMINENENIFDGKTQKEIEKIIYDKIQTYAFDEDFQFRFVIDYTPTLLNKARSYKDNGNTELAFIFYATYFEHKINDILDQVIYKKNLSDNTRIKILKNNIEDKYTWIFELLGIPNFQESILRTIKTISDNRNAFIHYKWVGREADYNKNYTSLFKEAEKVISYLDEFKCDAFLSNKANDVMKTVSAHSAFEANEMQND